MENQRRPVSVVVVIILLAVAGLATWYLPQVAQRVEDRDAMLAQLERWGSVRVPQGSPAGVPGVSLNARVRETEAGRVEGFLAFGSDEAGIELFLNESGFPPLVTCAPGVYDWPASPPEWWLQEQPISAPCIQDVTEHGVVRTILVTRAAEGGGVREVWPFVVHLYLHERDTD